jgi:hypothetical protein
VSVWNLMGLKDGAHGGPCCRDCGGETLCVQVPEWDYQYGYECMACGWTLVPLIDPARAMSPLTGRMHS